MTDARRLILLRHGQTAWNLQGRAQGHADISLDSTGVAQARAVAPHIAAYRPVRLWSSDLVRAVETAEFIAAATGLAIEKSEAFREYSVGDRTGLTVAEFASQFPEEYAEWRAGHRRALPGAEADGDVLARFLPALRSAMESLAPGECGVVVSHGAAVRTALVAALGLPDDVRDSLVGLRNCHWLELEESSSVFFADDVRWRLRAYNLFGPDGLLAEEPNVD